MTNINAFLKAKTHKDVLSLFEQGVNLEDFVVTHSTLWSLYVPRVTVAYAPVLSAHTDTVFSQKPVELVDNNGVLTNADSTLGLGADDRAGCYIMHKLIASGLPFIYILTDKEEVGGIGGVAFTKSPEFQGILSKTSCFIGLDRKGNTDCASYGYDNQELFDIFDTHGGYKYAYGSFTDVMTFSGNSSIACCNLSIGYYNEHTAKESLNTLQMEDTYNFLVEIPEILWEKQFLSESSYDGVYKEEFCSVDYKESQAVLCDVCQSHLPLYDVGWGLVCEYCLESVIEDEWRSAGY